MMMNARRLTHSLIKVSCRQGYMGYRLSIRIKARPLLATVMQALFYILCIHCVKVIGENK